MDFVRLLTFMKDKVLIEREGMNMDVSSAIVEKERKKKVVRKSKKNLRIPSGCEVIEEKIVDVQEPSLIDMDESKYILQCVACGLVIEGLVEKCSECDCDELLVLFPTNINEEEYDEEDVDFGPGEDFEEVMEEYYETAGSCSAHGSLKSGSGRREYQRIVGHILRTIKGYDIPKEELISRLSKVYSMEGSNWEKYEILLASDILDIPYEKLSNEFVEESKKIYMKEQIFNVIAKGIKDELDAEKIAKEKDGIVIKDEEDEDNFMVLAKESRAIKENLTDGRFSTEVDVVIHHKGGTSEVKSKLEYRINFEVREWGIKDILPIFDEDINVEYEDDEGESYALSINFDNVEIDWLEGHHYIPDSVEVYVKENSKIEKTIVNMYYIKPS